MGLPVRDETMEAARRPSSIAMECGSQARQPEDGGPECIFEYGNFRPDVRPSNPHSSTNSTRAWLLSSRLYSFNQGGVEHAAVRLEESGYAVFGYVVKASRGTAITGLLEETIRQYSPELYERDIVEVNTETGERVKCYVYHRPDVDRTRPVQHGDWCKRRA